MAQFIETVMFNLFMILMLLGLAVGGISLMRAPRPLTKLTVARTMLSYQLLFSIGIGFVYNFFAHTVYAEESATFIGWPNSPFQIELGFASLGFALQGLCGFRGSQGMRAAAVMGVSVFSLGAAGMHVYDMVTRGNFAPGNAGSVFYFGFLMPILCLTFLFIERRELRKLGAKVQSTKAQPRDSGWSPARV